MIDLENLENIEVELGGEVNSTNYEDASNKPKINNVELIGNKTAEDLNLQPAGDYLTEVPSEYKTKSENDELYQEKGEYLTEEMDPTVPSYVKDITQQDITNWDNKSEFSGDYEDLSNKPSIPSKTSDLNNDSGFIDKTVNNLNNYTKTSDLSSVATSGSYDDLKNKPTIPDELSDLSDDSTHRLVSDTEKSTWNAKSDFSGSYNDLTDKPTIPTVNDATLTIQKNNTTIDTFTANASSNKTINITVPTDTSDLTNGAGYTTNTGTITSVKMNGSTVSSSGEADLGTVITQHQDLTNYVQKSQTAGLIKNDGTIDTNTYLTQHQDISGKLDTSAVKTTTNTTQGNVYDVTYINTMLGDVESLLGGI